MKYAFSSNAFTNFTLNQAIEEISKIGYDGIEIMCDIPHAYPPNLTQGEIDGIKNHLSINNLYISNLNAFTLFAIDDTYHPSWIEDDITFRNKRIQHTIDSINLAKSLGANNISIEPGGPFVQSFDKKCLLKIFKQGLDKVLPQAEIQNITLLIEPEPSLLLESSGDFLEFIKNFESPNLKLNFDIGHFYCVNEDPSEIIFSLRDYIEHFHLADIKDRIHNHLIPGHGDINFKSVFKSIYDIGYDGFITVELYPYKQNPSKAAIESLEYIKNSIEFAY